MHSHETTMTGRLHCLLDKGSAWVLDERAWRLDLNLSQVPSVSEMDLARTALSELEACPRLNKELPHQVGITLETLYESLIIPDLKYRSEQLRLVKDQIDSTPVVATAVRRSKCERDEMYDSSDRVKVVQAYLESAAFQLDCCYRWTDNMWSSAKTNPEVEVERTLKDAISRIYGARDHMPMLDIDGW